MSARKGSKKRGARGEGRGVGVSPGACPAPTEAVGSLDEAAATAWLHTEGARELALLLMSALTCAYRMGRYGVAEGEFLSDEERSESLEMVKPLTYCIVKKVNEMGAKFHV